MTLSRRDFIRGGAQLVAFGLTAPTFLARTILNAPAAQSAARPNLERRILVVVQLGGGNDGLNTLVPYGEERYYALRPQLAIARDSVLPLDEGVGLHPNLSGLKAIWDEGQLAVVQGVGYPNPDRSHFRSMEIWHTANPETFERSGWLGRYLDACDCTQSNPVGAISVSETLNPSFWTEMTLVPAVSNVATFQFQTDPRFPRDRDFQLETLHQIYDQATIWRPYEEAIRRTTLNALAGAEELKRVAGGYQTSVEYPLHPFAQSLKLIGQVIASDVGTRVFFVGLGGFDTHAYQVNVHANLMRVLGDGLNAFRHDLAAIGRADDVLVMTFSEFGRRPYENASVGTDHGTAEPLFVLGSGVRGGLYGAYPSLHDMPQGDLQHGVDFRNVYATVLEGWLGTASVPVVGPGFGQMGFLA
jgi:uncharacterized protein (DUF1501 family)